MTTMDTFAVIGGDLRTTYLAGQLAQDGYKVITVGFDNADLPSCVVGCNRLSQAIAPADCVILPVPVSTDGIHVNAPFARMPLPLSGVLDCLDPGQYVVGGNVTGEVLEQFASRGLHIDDYLRREELAVQNAVPTAEGAIQLAMEELPVTINGASCLITGYGRVARVLSRLLVALGANVTVAARKYADLAWAATMGCTAVHLRDLPDAGVFDVIFNTAPALLFDDTVLSALDPGTLLIDLASKPGGVDFHAAAEHHIKTIWALSLPGRVAPKSAGGILKNTILNMVKEREGTV